MKEKIIMIIMAVALYALPAVAQKMEFRSTSTMQGSGNYVAPVTAVGAASAASEASEATTTSPSSGPHRVIITNNDNWQDGDEGSPIGDAVLPLMLFAGAFLCMRVFLRRKRALSR